MTIKTENGKMFRIKKLRMPLRCVVLAVFLLLSLFPNSGFSKMVGPYTGQVLDRRTGKPIKGASLFVYLTRYHLALSPAGSEYYPELIKSMLFYTDNKGKFTIPTKLISTGIPGSLETTAFIVYQPGYQAYININNVWIEKLDNRFKDKGNIIMLDRIPPNFDHKQHYERITSALDEMGEIHIIPPIYYDVFAKKNARMEWDKFVDKALLSAPKEEFLRRVEWEHRRQ